MALRNSESTQHACFLLKLCLKLNLFQTYTAKPCVSRGGLEMSALIFITRRCSSRFRYGATFVPVPGGAPEPLLPPPSAALTAFSR